MNIEAPVTSKVVSIPLENCSRYLGSPMALVSLRAQFSQIRSWAMPCNYAVEIGSCGSQHVGVATGCYPQVQYCDLRTITSRVAVSHSARVCHTSRWFLCRFYVSLTRMS